ncbi:unnamed protein product, partial [Musa textilis]
MVHSVLHEFQNTCTSGTKCLHSFCSHDCNVDEVDGEFVQIFLQAVRLNGGWMLADTNLSPFKKVRKALCPERENVNYFVTMTLCLCKIFSFHLFYVKHSFFVRLLWPRETHEK